MRLSRGKQVDREICRYPRIIRMLPSKTIANPLPHSQCLNQVFLSYEDDSRSSSKTPPHSVGYSRCGRFSEDGIPPSQPIRVHEAIIFRNDSDSTGNMNDFHVAVYNFSERMRYDLREANHRFSKIATQVAHACIAQPKFIKK